MDLVAPNLAALIGEIIGARLISHAGALSLATSGQIDRQVDRWTGGYIDGCLYKCIYINIDRRIYSGDNAYAQVRYQTPGFLASVNARGRELSMAVVSRTKLQECW